MKVHKVAIGTTTFEPALMPGGRAGDEVVVTVRSEGRQVGTFSCPPAQWFYVEAAAGVRARVEQIAAVTKDKDARAALERLIKSLG